MKGYRVIHRIVEKFREPSISQSSQELHTKAYFRTNLLKKGQLREGSVLTPAFVY